MLSVWYQIQRTERKAATWSKCDREQQEAKSSKAGATTCKGTACRPCVPGKINGFHTSQGGGAAVDSHDNLHLVTGD